MSAPATSPFSDTLCRLAGKFITREAVMTKKMEITMVACSKLQITFTESESPI
jgi:hypothetical protein